MYIPWPIVDRRDKGAVVEWAIDIFLQGISWFWCIGGSGAGIHVI
jgi:hypothetical protein